MKKDQKGAVDFIIVAAIFLVIAFFALMVYRFSTKGGDDAPVASDETSEQATEEVGEEQPSDNSENEPAESANFTEPYPVDGGYVCNGYWVENSEGWNTWYDEVEGGVQCYLSTWTQESIPPQITKADPNNTALIINFTQSNAGSVDNYIDEYYAGSEEWDFPTTIKDRAEYRFRIGSGAKVTTETNGRESTAYFYYDNGTIVHLSYTATDYLEHEARAIQMIGTLSRVQ